MTYQKLFCYKFSRQVVQVGELEPGVSLSWMCINSMEKKDHTLLSSSFKEICDSIQQKIDKFNNSPQTKCIAARIVYNFIICIICQMTFLCPQPLFYYIRLYCDNCFYNYLLDCAGYFTIRCWESCEFCIDIYIYILIFLRSENAKIPGEPILVQDPMDSYRLLFESDGNSWKTQGNYRIIVGFLVPESISVPNIGNL